MTCDPRLKYGHGSYCLLGPDDAPKGYSRLVANLWYEFVGLVNEYRWMGDKDELNSTVWDLFNEFKESLATDEIEPIDSTSEDEAAHEAVCRLFKLLEYANDYDPDRKVQPAIILGFTEEIREGESFELRFIPSK